jgi:hypothetical protein
MRYRRMLATTAVLGLGLVFASTASAEPVFDVFATATKNKTGSKKKPAPFLGSWGYTVTDGSNRPPTGYGSRFSFEGVKWDGKGLPTCTAQEIDIAQSDSVCPKGSLIVETTALEALAGPELDPSSYFACRGKTLRVYNSGPTTAAAIVVGPGDQCAGLEYTPPYEWKLSTKNGTTEVAAILPETVVHPLPGIASTGTVATYQFINQKAKVGKGKKKKTKYYFSSTKCKGERDFKTEILDEEGSHEFELTVGKCKKSKKKK